MKITDFDSDENILKEIGKRLKVERVRANLTQHDLSIRSGISKSTIERSEKGETIQIINLIKILRALNQLHSLEILLPSYEKTPMEYLEVHDSNTMQRYYASKKKTTPFKWGDEK